MPSVEQLDDLAAVRIVGFDGVNPLDRIATPGACGANKLVAPAQGHASRCFSQPAT
jgi:hypothetical protein